MLTFWRNPDLRNGALVGAAGMLLLFVASGAGYWLGLSQRSHNAWLDLKQVATAASGQNMAVATGAVSDDAEGVFFLDYLTGDLQCLVYYPRSGAFGARYYTNVQQHMPSSGKSAQYLMVTGGAVSNRTSSNVKPANCLVYVTDVNNGTFAAYTVPWNKTAESSSQAQLGALVFVGGGPIRNYQISDQPKKPAAGAAAQGKDPGAAANVKNNNKDNKDIDNNNADPADPANPPPDPKPPIKRKK